MAREQSLLINIEFESEASISKKLNALLKNIQKNNAFKIDLDTSSFNNSLKGLSSELNKINQQLNNTFNASMYSNQASQINNVTSAYKEQLATAKQIDNVSSKTTKVSLNPDGSVKEALSDVTKLNVGLGQTATIVNNVKSGMSTMTQSVSFDKINNTIDSMKSKLESLKSNNFIDDSVIGGLQSKLNSINTNTPEKEILELQSVINNLGNSESQIVRVQNAISKMQSNLTSMKGKYGNLVGDSSSINELKAYEGEIKNLQSILQKLNGGTTFSGSKISSELNKASSASKDLKNSVVQSSNALRLASKEASTLGDSLSRAFKNSGIFISTYQVFNIIRNGLTDIKNLDDALRDLKRVSDDVSASLINSFVSQANSMAIALGNTTEGVIKATTTFKQLGYTFKEASEYMAKNSIILSNVGDMSAEDSANAIVSILKGFRMEASQTTSVVDMLNEAGNRFAITTGQLAEGLRVGSASLAIANNDLAQSSALITAGTEVLRNPDQVANGLKTISMRLRGIADENGELVPEMQELVKSLSGVDITDRQTGNIRSTFDILNDLGKVWKKLGDKQQALLTEKIAGKTRGNVFASIMQNAEKLDDVYSKLQNSAGSAEAEQARYMDSISGKVNALSESFKKLWIDSINTESVKSLVDTGTLLINVFDGAINTFGAFPTVIATVVAGLTIFNTKFRESTSIFANCIPFVSNFTNSMNGMGENLSASITKYKKAIVEVKAFGVASQQAGVSTNGLGIGLAGLYGKLALTTAGLVATKIATIALQTAMSMGISLAISGAISLVAKLGKELIGTGKSMSECSSQAQELSNTLKGLGGDNDLISQYEKLNKKLEEGNLSESERKSLNEQIVEKKKELSNIDTEYKKVLDDTTASYQEQLNLLRGIYEVKLKDKAEDLDDEMMSQKKADRIASKLKQNIDAIKEYESQGTWMGSSESEERMAESFEKAKKNVKEYYTELSMYNSNVKLMEEANYSSGRSVIALDDDTKNLFNSLYDVQEGTVEASQEIDELGNSAESTSNKFKSLSDAISSSTNKIELIKQAIKEFNESGNGTISTSLEDKIFASNDAELIAMLADKNTFMEKANSLLEKEKTLREQNKKEILLSAQAEVDATNTKANTYGNDVTNKTNAENAKNNVTQNILNDMAKMTGKTIDELGKQYGIDTNNFNNAQNTKPSAIENVLNDMAKMTGKTVDELGTQYGIDVANFAKAQNEKISIAQSIGNIVGNVIDAGMSILKNNNNSNKVSSGYNPIKSSYNPVGSNYNSDKDSNKKKKEQQDIERTADRYQELKNKLDVVNDALDKNRILQEQAHGQRKIDLMNKEIELLKKQAQAEKDLENAYRRRANELRNTLSGKGASFDSDGNVSNYNALLESYRNRYNNNKTDANKKAYEDLKKLLEEYNGLVRDSINSSINDYEKAMNEIKNIQEEKAKLIADSEAKVTEIYKNELQKRTDEENKALQKKKELLNKQWNEEDNADARAELEKELSDIDAQIQQAIISGDKQLANALRKQYAEKQAELNKLIQDQQREAMSNEIDDKIQANEDKLEELMKPENINKVIKNALETGVLDVMGETIKLADATKNYINDTVTGVTSASLAYKELTDQIKEATNASLNMAQISSDLGLSNIAVISNVNSRSAIPQATSINNGKNISVVFNEPIVKVESMSGNIDEIEEMADIVERRVYKTLESRS